VIIVHTDGSGIATGGDAIGMGVVIHIQPPESAPLMVAAGYSIGEPGTHNRAELMAILLSLRMLYPRKPLATRQEGVWTPFDVWPGKFEEQLHVYSDSEWAIKSLRGLFRNKKHLGLLDKIRDEIRPWDLVHWHHIPGHSNHKWNEVADSLAGRARRDAVKSRQGFVALDVFRDGEQWATLDQPKTEDGLWELQAPRLTRT
jgi:ribonuclease HI